MRGCQEILASLEKKRRKKRTITQDPITGVIIFLCCQVNISLQLKLIKNTWSCLTTPTFLPRPPPPPDALPPTWVVVICHIIPNSNGIRVRATSVLWGDRWTTSLLLYAQTVKCLPHRVHDPSAFLWRREVLYLLWRRRKSSWLVSRGRGLLFNLREPTNQSYQSYLFDT